MSDDLRRYRTIRNAIKQLYPTEPKGNMARHLNTLVMLISGVVGSRRTNLPATVVYKKRALPIPWIVVEGSQGHFLEETHVQLLEQVRPIVPEGADVIFLGDGEFDGLTLQGTIKGYGWEYVCRTAKDIQLGVD